VSTYTTPTLVLRVPTGVSLTNQQVDDNFSNLLTGIGEVNTDSTASISQLSSDLNSSIALKSNITNPTFLGLVQAPTPSNTAAGASVATVGFVNTRLFNLVGNIRPSTTATSSTVGGVTTYSGIDLGTPTKRFANLYVESGHFAAQTITVGTASISASNTGGVVLPANTSVGPASNIIPTNLADKIELTSLSAQNATEGISSSLSYDDTTGVFTFTPVSLTGFATTQDVTNAINSLVDSAPNTLDTLNELAAALGDDSNFAGNLTTTLATKASITYVDNEIASLSTLHSPIFTGIPTAPTAAPTTNTTQLATTAFVLANSGGLNIDGGTATTIRNTSTIALNGGGA
tara:strand:- start:364 stop:1401 length:1038 start_codon:yes stop_codon:yes gene_type:complete